MIRATVFLLLAAPLILSAAAARLSGPQLLRVSYHRAKMNDERDYFAYPPHYTGQVRMEASYPRKFQRNGRTSTTTRGAGT